MQQYKKILGKVMMTAEGTYNSNKGYNPISLVTDEETGKSYISRKEVPNGTQINNREYWQPIASSGIIDNGVIILNRKNSDGQVPIYDLKSAAEAVAIGDRRGGVILGFLGFNPETDTVPTWKLYQYNDVSPSNWTNIDYWLPMDYTNKYAGWFDNEEALYDNVPFPKVGMYAYVGNSVSSAIIYRCYNDRIWQPTEDKAFSGVVNLADEEDITSKQNKLKFKDKEYNPAKYNGLGRIYLRKNMIDGKNILTQKMIESTNTIYIIQYDYDLQGQSITIHEGCILDFQGGSFNNGSIVLTKTNNIQGTTRFTNLYIRGDYGYSISADWFENLNACLNSIKTNFKNIILSAKEYYIDTPLNLNEGYILQGCNKDEWTDKYSTSIKVSDTFVGDSVIVIGETNGNHNVKILNINIRANSDINGITVPYNFYGLELNNVYVYNADKSFSFSTFWTSIINKCNSYNSKYGFYLDGQTTTSTNFNNCVVFGGETAFHINISLNGTSFTNCATDGSKIGFDILYGGNVVIDNLTVEQFYTHAIKVNHSTTKLYVNNLAIGANYVSNSHIVDIENIGAAIFVNCAMPSAYMPSDNSYYGIYIADTIDASKVVFVSCLLYDYRSPSFKNATHLMSSVAPFKSLGLERYIPQVIKYPYGTELNTMSIESEFVDIVPDGSSRILKANPIFVTNAKNNSIITLINKGEYSITIMSEDSYYGETGIIGSTIVLHPNDSVRLNYRDSKFYVVDKKGKATNSSRPSLSADEVGEGLFDTDLNKPIWWTGTKWVNANGVEV